MSNESTHSVEAQMLIRKPVDLVFDAFVDPSITKNFWFTHGSGRLEKGKTITWEWEMYGVSAKVHVKEVERNKKIIIDWGEPPTTVEFIFQSLGGDKTYVRIRNYGLQQQGDDLIEMVRDLTGGFTTVLDGLKAWLEHNINLNLVADKFPKEVSDHGK